MPPMIKKKVLLMGRSGSGKTSMRSVIFQNTLPNLTHRLGATIDVEQSHQRFLGSLVVNLWDCGGQRGFLDSYLSVQRSTVFAHVGVLIYVFDVEAAQPDWEHDLGYYRECLNALSKFSPNAVTFVLVHKMDLVSIPDRPAIFAKKRSELLAYSNGLNLNRIFGTSIWDETLYKAWSHIVHTLIPNANQLTKNLTTLTRACGAVEAVVFEKTTFLLIAHSEGIRSTTDENLLSASSSSSPISASASSLGTDGGPTPPRSIAEKTRIQHVSRLPGNRFERISSLLKIFKLSCPQWSSERWTGLQMRMPTFTAVIEPLTANSYVLILSADDRITPEAIRVNIRMARKKFEDLQAGLV